ncbi:MAG: hypothetical protein FJY85_03830 [Deltaproteobacteria bacterium]|nr:hypothetical protein [Deltaproteobacteria bacterium]
MWHNLPAAADPAISVWQDFATLLERGRQKLSGILTGGGLAILEAFMRNPCAVIPAEARIQVFWPLAPAPVHDLGFARVTRFWVLREALEARITSRGLP